VGICCVPGAGLTWSNAHEVRHLLDGLDRLGPVHQQPLAIVTDKAASVADGECDPGHEPVLHPCAERLDVRGIESGVIRRLAVDVFRELLGHLHVLIPAPGLGRVRRRIRQASRVEHLLVVPDDLDLVGHADADDLPVRCDELQRIQLGRLVLVEVRQIDEPPVHTPGEHVRLVKIPEVRQAVAGRQSRDLRVELGIGPEVQRFDLHVRVLGHVALQVRIRSVDLVLVSPEGILKSYGAAAGGFFAARCHCGEDRYKKKSGRADGREKSMSHS